MIQSSSILNSSFSILEVCVDRELTSFDYRRVIDTIRRANAIAAIDDLDTLLEQMLALFVEVAGAEAGTLYLYDQIPMS